MIKIVSVEVTDCPRVFTLAPPVRTSFLDKFRIATDPVTLTLWCEHPGEWHPWHDASYELRQERDWMVQAAPYLSFVLKALRLVVPVASAVAGVILPKPDIEELGAEIELMKLVVEKLPRISVKPGREEEASTDLTSAEGAGLRAFRALLFRYDESRYFGDLRRAQAASGEYLWVCPKHHQEYDPGLPVLIGDVV
jgi:internalin A